MAYGTASEFLRRIKVAAPTAEQTTQAQQCLDAASLEIDSYLSTAGVVPSLSPAGLALATTVNYERAAEHWRLLPYGALPGGPDLPPVLTARDSFYRHAMQLKSLKTSWAVA